MVACTWYATMASPVGRLLVAGDDHELIRLGFQEGPHPVEPEPDWTRAAALPIEVEEQLAEYFAGERRSFALPLAAGPTPFQQAVRAALAQVPYGATIGYGALARRLGRPGAARAVGAAAAANPLPLVVPCHRLVGAAGQLTGFVGGLAAKEYLLALERGGRSDASMQLEFRW